MAPIDEEHGDPTAGDSGHEATDRLAPELSHPEFHDPLTGLGNRALFVDRLGHALQKTERNNDRIAALVVDMDGLSGADDRLGQAAGERLLLQSMAGVLLRCIRRSDTAARLGGHKFGVIVEEFSYQREVEALADRILVACRAPIAVEGHDLSGSVSIGFAFSRRGMTVDELMSNADRALDAAKDRGQDRAERFEDWMPTTRARTG